MKKINLLLFLALVCAPILGFAAKSVVIKYSVNDCIFCNMQLQSFRNIAKDYNTVVVFRSQYNNNGLPEIREQISEMGMKMRFSDSLYYAYDSSERSMLYILDEGNKPVVNEYLKTVDMGKIKTALSGNVAPGNINFMDLTALRTDGNYIYMAGSGATYILKVAKNKPGDVYDTVRVFSTAVRKEVFKTYFGNMFQAQLDTFDKLSQKYRVPKTFNVTDFQVSGDSVFVLAMTNAIDIVDSAHMRVNNLPFMMLVVNKQVRTIVPVNYAATYPAGEGNKKQQYHLNPRLFFYYKGGFYISLGKDSLSGNDALFAKAMLKNNKLVIGEVLPYNLPPALVANKVGYMMQDKIYSNGIVSNVYSTTLFNVTTGRIFDLGIEDAGNDFSYQDAMNLTLKVNFRIIGMNYSNNLLHVVYKKQAALYAATYKLSGKQPVKLDEKQLTTSFPDERFSYAIICDDNGICNYDYRNYRFVHYSY